MIYTSLGLMSKSFSEVSWGKRSLPPLLLAGWAKPCPSPALGDPFDSAATASADFAMTGINREMVLIRSAESEEIPPVRDRRSAAGDCPFEDSDRHLRNLPPFHRRQTERGPPWVDPGRKEDLAGVDISDPGNQPLIHQKRFHREPPSPGYLPKTARRKASERIFHKRRGALLRLHGEGRKPARINQDKRSGGKIDHQTAVIKKRGLAPDSPGIVQRFSFFSAANRGERRNDAFLPEKPSGHPEMKLRRQTAADADLQEFSPPFHGLDPPPNQILDFPQPGIEDLDSENLLTRQDGFQLAAEGFDLSLSLSAV
jgi:hypothetical protein